MFTSEIKESIMVVSKTVFFDEELQLRANLFKALSHPARLQILQYLAQTRICLSGDISEMFPISRGTVNQHMRELKNAKLIVGHEWEGKIYYCLNLDKMEEMQSVLSGFLEEIKIPADFCCERGSFKNTY